MTPDNTDGDAIVWRQRFETTFHRIQTERMDGVPILNRALVVEALGFERFMDARLGVLITPWFMNLVRVSPAGTALPGETQARHLPCGVLPFTGAREDDLGAFESCSLFSPMFEFSAQEEARVVAEEVLLEIRRSDAGKATANHPVGPVTAMERNMGRPYDRRAFLGGRFLRDDGAID